MTLAIAHVEADGLAFLDAVREIKPPFSPDEAVIEYSNLLKSYGISTVVGDAYAGQWPRERFEVNGIRYELSDRNKSTIYTDLLPALNGKRIRLLDNPRLIGQLCALERRVSRGGRDSIDHSPGSHDDLANAAAGALTYCLNERRPALISQAQVQTDGRAVPIPDVIDFAYGIMVTGDNGDIATVFFAKPVDRKMPLLVLDFICEPMSGNSMRDAIDTLKAFREQARIRYGVMMFMEENLVSLAQEIGFQAKVISPSFMKDMASVALHAATFTAQGRVKLCVLANEKSKVHPLGGALLVRSGDDIESPLSMASLLGIAMGMSQHIR
jgi:hypothetical protein